MDVECFECGERVDAPDVEALADALLAHARARHNWPFGDQAVRNYAEATQRLTGPSERVDTIGELTVVPVTEDRIDDWLAFFDRDAFVGKPEWAACYCLEPHIRPPDADERADVPHWRANREAMVTRLRGGAAFGYLAYSDGRPVGWVNASKRSDYALYREGASAEPADGDVVGVSCFIIGPAYRRHGVAAALLDRVIADAPARGVSWIEAYPFDGERGDDAANFRGPRAMFDERGFAPVDRREGHTIVRRPV